MQVQIAPNGWPGIFIPGDEALGLAAMLRLIADAPTMDEARGWLRRRAEELEACKVSKKPDAA
jgi:hypothetical protein